MFPRIFIPLCPCANLERILLGVYECACSREISSDGERDDGRDSWRNVSETGRLAWVFSEEQGEPGGEQDEADGGDTRKSGVAETGKREEKREKRQEKRRGRGLPATQAHQ